MFYEIFWNYWTFLRGWNIHTKRGKLWFPPNHLHPEFHKARGRHFYYPKIQSYPITKCATRSGTIGDETQSGKKLCSSSTFPRVHQTFALNLTRPSLLQFFSIILHPWTRKFYWVTFVGNCVKRCEILLRTSYALRLLLHTLFHVLH